MKRIMRLLTLVVIFTFGLVPVLHAQGKQPGIVILKGNPSGGVKFDHVAHAKRAGEKCTTCHHASNPVKPMKSAQEKCQDCHAKAVAAPMKTPARLAFHDSLAKKGVCIDCHAKVAAAGKKAPLKCPECHVKANV